MSKQFTFFILLTAFLLHPIFIHAENVAVKGRQLLVNGKPYLIKGICYNPVPKGERTRSFEYLAEDLALMQEAGINTIRVYSPIDDEAVLDQIKNAGIRVIVGFGFNQNGYYDILSGSFIDYIKQYKDHEAILLWELGNEYNYHPEWFDGNIENWYTALNDAASEIHDTDPDHPVATAHGELPDAMARSMSPNVDIWGMNVYRWDDPSEIFSQWKALSKKPMYLAEAGADSYMTVAKNSFQEGVNEFAQAKAVENILNNIFNHTNICSGVTLFAFSDEWWKAGDIETQDPGGWAPNSSGVPYDGSPNEEYWGIVDVDRNKKKVFRIVKTKFKAPTK